MLICRNFQEEFITFFTTAAFSWLLGYFVATITTPSQTSDVYDSSEDETEITVENSIKTKQKRKKGVLIRLR